MPIQPTHKHVTETGFKEFRFKGIGEVFSFSVGVAEEDDGDSAAEAVEDGVVVHFAGDEEVDVFGGHGRE